MCNILHIDTLKYKIILYIDRVAKNSSKQRNSLELMTSLTQDINLSM